MTIAGDSETPKPEKPKRKRQAKRLAMSPDMRAAAEAAIEKHRDRFAAPQLAISGDWENWQFDCPYKEEDRDHWMALLFETFGTRSLGAGRVFLRQLAALAGKGWNAEDQEWRPELEELNAAIAIVASVKPENEAQAAQAAQMVALHLTAMGLGRNCANMTYPDERTVSALVRATRAYARSARDLAELQGKLQPRAVMQTIEVIYIDKRQQTAIVGGDSDFGGQPYAAQPCAADNARGTRLIEASAQVPGEQPGRGLLRLASRKGAESVPDAWWRRIGRALWHGQR